MQEEGVGEVLLDDNATAQAPRPGWAYAAPGPVMCQSQL